MEKTIGVAALVVVIVAVMFVMASGASLVAANAPWFGAFVLAGILALAFFSKDRSLSAPPRSGVRRFDP